MMIVPRTRDKKVLRDRLHSRPLSILLMVVVWCALWGSVHPMTLVGGLLFGFLITVVFPLPPLHWEGRVRPVGVVVMIAHLLWDLVRSSWRMLQLAFERKVDLNAGIISEEEAIKNADSPNNLKLRIKLHNEEGQLKQSSDTSNWSLDPLGQEEKNPLE